MFSEESMVINSEHAGFFKTIDPLQKATNFTSRKVFAQDIFTRGHAYLFKIVSQIFSLIGNSQAYHFSITITKKVLYKK